jgi:hypothetical protein
MVLTRLDSESPSSLHGSRDLQTFGGSVDDDLIAEQAHYCYFGGGVDDAACALETDTVLANVL